MPPPPPPPPPSLPSSPSPYLDALYSEAEGGAGGHRLSPLHVPRFGDGLLSMLLFCGLIGVNVSHLVIHVLWCVCVLCVWGGCVCVCAYGRELSIQHKDSETQNIPQNKIETQWVEFRSTMTTTATNHAELSQVNGQLQCIRTAQRLRNTKHSSEQDRNTVSGIQKPIMLSCHRHSHLQSCSKQAWSRKAWEVWSRVVMSGTQMVDTWGVV